MKNFRITYSVLNADLSELHAQFDKALLEVKSQLPFEAPSIVEGRELRTGNILENFNPAQTKELLGRFHIASETDLQRAVTYGKNAQACWALTPWSERLSIIRKAADLISERRLEYSVRMGLETGKNRLECLGDVEEAADLLRYYANQVEETNGFTRPLSQLSSNELTRSVLRPYGVFGVVSPFNFPLALAAGMSGAALVSGNAVILKPSQETPWSAYSLYEALRDAGLPNGVFQLIFGTGSELGKALVEHDGIDGIAFTGSYEVGMQIFRTFSKEFPKPCLLEMGGKNAAIVCKTANIDDAVEGCYKSAFGLSGQKCSALSRVFVHKFLKDEFLRKLVEKAKSIVIGDPMEQSVYMGPVISQSSVERYLQAVSVVKKDGALLLGGNDLREINAYSSGHFVAPVIAELPRGHELCSKELFAPFLLVDSFETIEEAVAQANSVPFGLTSGIFSSAPEEIEYYLSNIQSGVVYVNRKAGATTGAWPGVQAFCGWKGSGSTGKGGCGPYYVSQFMREQSHTIVT